MPVLTPPAPLFRCDEWVVPIATTLSERYNYGWKQREVRSHLGNAIKIKSRYWDNYDRRWIYMASKVHYVESELMLKDEYAQLKKGLKLKLSSEDFCNLL